MKKNNYKLPELSVFFPAYNEAGNIAESIKQAYQILPKIAKKFEVIVIDDGSTDGTKTIATRLSKRFKNLRVITQKNRGYGGALKRGFKEAKHNWIFFTDSDLQFDITELTKFVKHATNYPLIIGYRKNRAEGWTRKLLADMLKIWNIVILGYPTKIKDTDCAFKLINKSVIKTIEPLFSDGAMISTEILIKAHYEGFELKQLGVRHFKRHIGNPTGNNHQVILKAVIDTFILKYMLVKQTLKKSGQNILALIVTR